MILEHPKQMTAESYARLQESIDAKRQEGAYLAMILEEGVKAAQMRSSNRDSQFDESRERQAKEICRVFGVRLR